MTKERSIRSLLLEVFSIVLGVLLALAVSEWQQDRARDELAKTALQNVLNELQVNSEVIAKVHENNLATITLAGTEAEDGQEEEVSFIPGVQVRDSAWQALLSSGVSSYIDYQLLLTLSKTYSQQAVYVDLGMKLVDASVNIAALNTANNTSTDPVAFQREFMAFFEMTVAIETAIMETYTQSKAAIEQSLLEKK